MAVIGWKLVGAMLLVAVALPHVMAAGDEEEGSDSDFSASALFIGFREALEACVIISVMLNMLDKTNHSHLKKWVWIGSFAGLFVSCVIGGGMVGAYYALKDNVMSDNDMYIFEGVFSGIASLFLTFLGIGFLRFADLEKKWSSKLFKRDDEPLPEPRTLKEKMKAKYGIQSQAIDERQLVTAKNFGASEVEASVSASDDSGETSEVNHWTIIVLCFSAVFREGLETFLFLGAVGSNSKPSGLALGGLVGVVLGVAFGIAVLYIGRAIDNLMWFFIMTTVFILFIAAGLAGYSAHEFEELGKEKIGFNDPIIMRPLWDISDCCPDSKGPGAVFRAIAGYQDKPTMIEALVYLGYWIIVITLMVLRYKAGILFSKRTRVVYSEESPPSSVTDDKLKTRDLPSADLTYTAGESAQPLYAGGPTPYPAMFPGSGYGMPMGMMPMQPPMGGGMPMMQPPMGAGMPMMPMQGMQGMPPQYPSPMFVGQA